MPARGDGLRARIVTVVAGFALVAAALSFGGTGSAVAQEGRTVSVSPSSGPPGSTVTVSGSGWTSSNPEYVIYWEERGALSLAPSRSATAASPPA